MSDEVPYRFDRTSSAAELALLWGSLGPGEESGHSVSVAGRVMLLRTQGKLAFAELRDSSGAIQLFALAAQTERFDELTHLNLGDWIGARGEVVRTRRGELSVKVADWVVLARARRSFGDKWRGITDPEVRLRHREVDLWANESTRAALATASSVSRHLRERLWAKGFVEIETPVLHPVLGGTTARPFVTHHNALDTDFYLRIAEEIYLKRLVVGGFEKVFEIGRTFRNEGLSPRHNPEFTLLEAYQAYADYTDLMPLFEELVAGVAEDVVGTTKLTYQGRPLDLTPPWPRATMAALTSEAVGQPVDVHTDPGELARLLERAGGAVERSWGPGKLFQELYEKTVETTLWGPIFVCDYPAEVSPLARQHRLDPDLVERFEPIVAGRELGNAYTERVDPDEQRASFEEQAAQRAAGDDEAMEFDEDYLFALEHGLPPTGGIGLGVDRLAMLLADVANIREVIAFPALRPERRESPPEG
jgi:lysyl-tRNA synthetase, class II